MFHDDLFHDFIIGLERFVSFYGILVSFVGGEIAGFDSVQSWHDLIFLEQFYLAYFGLEIGFDRLYLSLQLGFDRLYFGLQLGFDRLYFSLQLGSDRLYFGL